MRRFSAYVISAALVALGGSVQAQDWSGGYYGVLLGGGMGDVAWHGINGSSGGQGGDGDSLNAADYDLRGAAIGGVVGYNMQTGAQVMGIEADLMVGKIEGDGLGGVGSSDRPFSSETNALGTLTGRYGQVTGNTLLYAEAGGAFIRQDHSHTNGSDDVMTASETRGGWVVGIGLDHDLGNGWSLKAELNHMQFNSSAIELSGDGADSAFAIDNKMNRIAFGATRRF